MTPHHLLPTPDEPASAAQERAELEAQITHLRQVVHGRAVMDQAVGVLLALGRFTPAAGQEVLHAMSARTGLAPRQVARHLVTYASSGELPAPLREELERHIAAARSAGGAQGHPPL
ncbi:ANTAR domain-containing protein [Streptomyces sp. NPDC049813]|uniref:ANTAR domain-containing protein n=1 Tax=Streptomyces sp. NPDC049813 TaxID=3365597 RepID=UPI0037A16FA5